MACPGLTLLAEADGVLVFEVKGVLAEGAKHLHECVEHDIVGEADPRAGRRGQGEVGRVGTTQPRDVGVRGFVAMRR